MHRKVLALQEQSSRRMKAQADAKRRDVELQEGQRVWLSTAHLPLRDGTRKLAEKWTGPYRIAARVTREAWRLELPPQLRLHPVFHTSQLKPVHGNPRQSPPIQLADQEEHEFEVDRLLDTRTVRGVKQYLVRWKGYSAFDDSWEPASNLANAAAKVAEFEGRSRASRGRGRGSRGR